MNACRDSTALALRALSALPLGGGPMFWASYVAARCALADAARCFLPRSALDSGFFFFGFGLVVVAVMPRCSMRAVRIQRLIRMLNFTRLKGCSRGHLLENHDSPHRTYRGWASDRMPTSRSEFDLAKSSGGAKQLNRWSLSRFGKRIAETHESRHSV